MTRTVVPLASGIASTMRFKKSDKRFRTREQIAADVATILNADLTYGTKWSVIDNAMWSWTEFDGKFVGCQRWTQMAILRYVEFGGKRGWKKHLRHEHVVPRSVVSQLVLALPEPTPTSVFELFSKLVVGCIVDCTEDAVLNKYRSSMPAEFDDPSHADYRNPWLRYERCSIVVHPEVVGDDVLGGLAKNPRKLKGKK